MELGHKIAKGGLPSSISEKDDNLGPIHRSCNNEQGSTPHQEPRIMRKDSNEW